MSQAHCKRHFHRHLNQYFARFLFKSRHLIGRVIRVLNSSWNICLNSVNLNFTPYVLYIYFIGMSKYLHAWNPSKTNKHVFVIKCIVFFFKSIWNVFWDMPSIDNFLGFIYICMPLYVLYPFVNFPEFRKCNDLTAWNKRRWYCHTWYTIV